MVRLKICHGEEILDKDDSGEAFIVDPSNGEYKRFTCLPCNAVAVCLNRSAGD